MSLTPPDASSSPGLREANLREAVLEKVSTAIITGEIAEGELISAPSLGQLLGVSTTPVREAMMSLAREGLVETVKNKGFRVTAMSDKELDDLAQVRLLLEPHAMAFVAENIPEEAFAPLERLADLCFEAAESQNLVEYLRGDREFHALLLAHTGNEFLVELATSLRRRTRLYGIAALAKKGELSASAKEHHQLLTLLKKRDGVGAEKLMRAHIGHARKEWATGVPSLRA